MNEHDDFQDDAEKTMLMMLMTMANDNGDITKYNKSNIEEHSNMSEGGNDKNNKRHGSSRTEKVGWNTQTKQTKRNNQT